MKKKDGFSKSNLSKKVLQHDNLYQFYFGISDYGLNKHDLFHSALQKEVQRNDEAQHQIHDATCLWLWVKTKMADAFPGDVVDRHQKLFDNGCLVAKIFWLANNSKR